MTLNIQGLAKALKEGSVRLEGEREARIESELSKIVEATKKAPKTTAKYTFEDDGRTFHIITNDQE